MNPMGSSRPLTNNNRVLMVVLVVLSAIFVMTRAQTQVVFKFREEQDPTAYVGNFALKSREIGTPGMEDTSGLRFFIHHSDYFAINETTGAITTTRTLDREKICAGKVTCDLEVEITVYKTDAENNFDLYKILTCVVIVQDINDNAPTFLNPSVSLSISERNAVGDVLRTSGAVDMDTGKDNSVKQYRLLDESDIFSLNVIQNPDGSSYLGIVVNQVLDREIRDFYQVTVIASDGGFPQKSGQVVINITVTDANDNPPVFLRPSYNESVRENVPLNVVIMKVEAKDIDAGMNAEISYRFSAQVSEKVREKLWIDEQTGEIFSLSNIDYEADKSFKFVVEASDHGLPQYTSRVGVTLYIIDVNDNSPQININLALAGTDISELEPVGKFIAHVSVFDRDEGVNKVVLCDIDDPYFSLEKFYKYESNMYKVVLRKPLDHEFDDRHKITITCTDSGTPPRTNSSSFEVKVLDENDNRPAFSEPVYYGNVHENVVGEIPVVTVTAHDWDSGENGRVSYSMENKYNDMFKINPSTGAISVFGPLDRESTQTYEFHVIARDNSEDRLSSSSLVIVTVIDENDNSPRFLKPVFLGDVLENQPSGTPVGNVTAVDKDDVENSKIEYSILKEEPNDGDSFSINSRTGIIKSKTVFDREQKSLYHFRIRVKDPSKPSFYDTCNFTARVLDDNDHAPVIKTVEGENSTHVITYYTPLGSVITSIEAHDGDSLTSKFSQLVYFIVQGDPEQLFNLNRFTGSLTLARLIRAKDARSYHLFIRVEDGGDPPQFDTKEIFIKINGTIPAGASSGGIGHNILIVIILVGVTIVLGLAIMTTICLVKKIDRERRRTQNANEQKNLEDKMYQIKQEEIFTRAAIVGTEDANANKKGKKEVSFSFDEETDSHNTSTGSGQPLTTSFRSGGDKAKPNGQYVTGNTRVGNRLGPPDMNIPMDLVQKQNNLRRSPQDEESHLIEILRQSAEDALSESSGESDPSDSGRGGSEDDSSNRGSGLDPELSNGLYPPVIARHGNHGRESHQNHPYQQHLYPSQGRARQVIHAKGRQLSRLSPLTQASPRDSLSSDIESDLSLTTGSRTSQSRTDSERSANRNIPYSDDQFRSANEITLHRGSRDHLNRRMVQDSPHRLSTPYNPSTNNSTNSLLRSFHSQPNDHSYSPNRIMSSFSLERLPQSNNNLSDRSRSTTPSERSGRHRNSDRFVMPPGDRRLTPMSLVEEDDRTTTSGSYSINADELRQEIDELILHDSIV